MPSDVTTIPSDIEHVSRRVYTIKVDAGHRPAQLPRGSVTSLFAEEVTTANANEYSLLFIRDDLRERLTALFADDFENGSTYNDLLEKLLNERS